MKERELIQKFVNILSEIDGSTAISATDFTEEREANMIVVGIESTEQVNPLLPDYAYTVSIVVDCFIDSDEDGEIFRGIHKEVRRILDEYVNKEKPLESMFEEIPVVGMFPDTENETIDDKSNRVTMTYRVIASF